MANSFIAAHKEVELRGYFMRHKSGGDVGFSWNKDDPKFSDQWERITAVPESPSSTPTAGGERQSIDTPEFQSKVGNWAGAALSDDEHTRTVSAKEAWAALIAHINTWAGRSAGDAVPAGFKLAPIMPTDEMLKAGARFLRIMSVPQDEARAIYRAMIAAAPAADTKADAACRCSAQGGNTIIDHDINGKPVYLATPANTAPAVQPEMAKHLQARTWQPITKPGQVKVGDKLRFTIGDDKFSETAKVILHAGTDREEIIYNKRRNYYLITSLSIKNSGSSKNVEFLPQGQNSASNGATGEKA